MELIDIRTECRNLLSDDVEPYGISDEALTFRLNEAEKEACTRADLLVDSSSSKICQIDVVAGINNYKLNPIIVDVLRAGLPSANKPLKKSGYKILDEEDSNWMTRTGTPNSYSLDVETNMLYLSHVPLVDETLTLTVSRLPWEELECDSDEPEINSKYHYDLIYWALHLCYSVRDLDSYDQIAADKYEAKFIEKFGTRKTSKDLEQRLRKHRRRAKARFI